MQFLLDLHTKDLNSEKAKNIELTKIYETEVKLKYSYFYMFSDKSFKRKNPTIRIKTTRNRIKT